MARTVGSSSQQQQQAAAAKANAAAGAQKQDASQKPPQRQQQQQQQGSTGSASRPKPKVTIVGSQPPPSGQQQKPPPVGGSLGDIEDYPLITLAAPPKRLVQKVAVGKSVPAPADKRPAASVDVDAKPATDSKPAKASRKAKKSDGEPVKLALKQSVSTESFPSDAGSVNHGASAAETASTDDATVKRGFSGETKGAPALASTDSASLKRATSSDSKVPGGSVKRSQSALSTAASSDAEHGKRSLQSEAGPSQAEASADSASVKRTLSSDSKVAAGAFKRSQSCLSAAASSDPEALKRGNTPPDVGPTRADDALPSGVASVGQAPGAATGEAIDVGGARADEVRASSERVDSHAKGLNMASFYVSAQPAEASQGELGGLLPCAKLPRGLKVSTSVVLPPPWANSAEATGMDAADSEAEAEVLLNVPPLVSFRELLIEQHPEAFRVQDDKEASGRVKSNGMRQAPDSPRSGDSAFGTQPDASQGSQKGPSVPPTLADIGRRDPLSEAIRSMENRLARQGLLAAPASILGRKAANKAAGADAEFFYDPTDAFIDDADLEEVNAYDNRRAANGKHLHPSSKRPGGGADSQRKWRRKEDAEEEEEEEADGDPDDGSQHPEGKVDRATQRLNLAAFRLSGAEVSGTSGEESGSDMDSDLEGAHRMGSKVPLDSRNWREQLNTLEKELVLVPNFALNCQPAGVGLSAPASPSRASLMPGMKAPATPGVPSAQTPAGMPQTPRPGQPATPAAPHLSQPATPAMPHLAQPMTPAVPHLAQPATPAAPHLAQPATPAAPHLAQPATPAAPHLAQPATPAAPHLAQPATPAAPHLAQPATPAVPHLAQPATPAVSPAISQATAGAGAGRAAPGVAVEVSHVSSDSSSVDIMDADADGADLTELRTALWDFGTSVEQAARRRPRSSMQDALEASIRAVWRRLPGLLRPVTSGPRPLRWKLHALEPYTADARYPGDVFPWDHTEEVAWGRFLWRLIKTAAPKVGRSSFVRRFVNAVREPQRELMGEAIASMRRQLRGAYIGSMRGVIEGAVKRWQSEEEAGPKKNHLRTLFPLAGTLKNLQRCWFRQRFWEEQRKTFRLRAPVRRLTQTLLPCFSIYVVKHINDFVMLSLPMDMTMALVRDVLLVSRPKDVRKKRTASKRCIIPSGYFLPLRLPARIFIRLGGHKLEAILQAVYTLDRQSVRVGDKQYKSMMVAGQEVLKELREKDPRVNIPPKIRNCLHQRHGAWTLWRFSCKMRVMPLTFAVKLAFDRKIVAFINPPNEPPCPPLMNPPNPNKDHLSLQRERNEFLSDLCVGQWVQCFYEGGTYGLPGRHYNAQIVGLKSHADSSFRGRSILVDVEYVHGPREEEVPVTRLKPVTIWEPDNIAAVRLGGQWWRGVVKKVIMDKDVSGMQFEVRLNDRTVTVPFCDMRQEYSKRSRKEDPLQRLMSTHPTTAATAEAKGRPPAAPADKPQQRLLPGQHVKYLDRGCWVRGKVREDRGERVAVVTHSRSGRAGGRDVPVVVTLERDQVVKLPGKTVKVKRASRAGLKHKQAKNFRVLGAQEDPIAVTDSDD